MGFRDLRFGGIIGLIILIALATVIYNVLTGREL